MGGESKIREYWTVEASEDVGIVHLIDNDNRIMAHGLEEEIEILARYLNEYEHVLKAYGKFITDMEKIYGE